MRSAEVCEYKVQLRAVAIKISICNGTNRGGMGGNMRSSLEEAGDAFLACFETDAAPTTKLP